MSHRVSSHAEPMSDRFTHANASSLEAVGRVSSGGRKLPLTLTIDTDGVLLCTDAAGFSISVKVADIMNVAGRRFRVGVHSSKVECTLADGTVILCEGHMNPTDGRLRLDAVDQNVFYWFWFEVRPSFRRGGMNRV